MNTFIKLSSPATGEFWKIPVLFEDDQLLALDKPARLLASPDRYDAERPNLMKLLHRDLQRGAAWARERPGLNYLMNAHRLDFETTGVILLAKDRTTLVALANQFGASRPVKRYLALVRGVPPEIEFEVDARLAPHPFKPGLMKVDPKKGKRSHTRFRLKERFAGYSLIECFPTTGRTHQIRVHLRHARCPLLGDPLYGGGGLRLSQLKSDYYLKANRTERPLIGSIALHAESLEVEHPVRGTPVGITAPWPKDLVVAVKYLRRFAPAEQS
jgi:RluA family pseudouridine synthase